MKIYIKNMVCKRCRMVVAAELEKLGIHNADVEMGEAEFEEKLSQEQFEQLDAELKNAGLELISDRKSILTDKIERTIFDLVHYADTEGKVTLSAYLSEKLNYDYTYLANLYSEVTGMTLERFYLTHKIERVKELIIYNELSISEIADLMHYSSVAHLSNQFRKFTGVTPTRFKMMNSKRLIPR